MEVVGALMSATEARARIRAGFDMARNGRRALQVLLSRRGVKLHVYGRVSGQSGASDNRGLATSHHLPNSASSVKDAARVSVPKPGTEPGRSERYLTYG